MKALCDLVVLIKGAGDLGSGVVHRLFRAGFKLCLTETARPQAVRRGVSFCEAVYEGEKKVEGVVARLATTPTEISRTWADGKIPLLVDPQAAVKDFLRPDVLVDAIIAKRNLGTAITDAPLVIGLGPGFRAGVDVHAVIETNRGHNLGRVIWQGEAEPNTGIPGEIDGVTTERVLRAPTAGQLITRKDIGDYVQAGETVALVNGSPVIAQITGILRGLLRSETPVHQGMKLGDIDARAKREHCFTISDKARAIGGGVLEAILGHYSKPGS
ncbi:MAG: EF2563 family selenium-dependent molybdenum hydroxylase system protein [Chloroflexi bacterium]|nr:EF2563 family selenium-dependent molybdenum hydroxylase system protein [Chloroflexota bacterium]